MKKTIGLLCLMAVLLSMTLTAFAGSVPEDLLHSDDAQVFFAEVLSYHPGKENPDIEVSPTKVIKGDVKAGTKQIYYDPYPLGNIDIKVGKVYLFTYFDENNPTYIFEVTSYNTSTLKLKNVEGDMWERFEQYLNEGRYEDAEHERIDRKNEGLPIEGEDISLAELIGVPKEDAESINIHYNGEVHEIDVNKFYRVIDDIVLTDIEDVIFVEPGNTSADLPNGMYITVNGLDGYAFITDDCMVDKNAPSLSILPVGAYTIKFVDRAKITALFAIDEYGLPFLETPLAGRLFRYGVLIVFVFAAAFVIGFVVKKKKGASK